MHILSGIDIDVLGFLGLNILLGLLLLRLIDVLVILTPLFLGFLGTLLVTLDLGGVREVVRIFPLLLLLDNHLLLGLSLSFLLPLVEHIENILVQTLLLLLSEDQIVIDGFILVARDEVLDSSIPTLTSVDGVSFN